MRIKNGWPVNLLQVYWQYSREGKTGWEQDEGWIYSIWGKIISIQRQYKAKLSGCREKDPSCKNQVLNELKRDVSAIFEKYYSTTYIWWFSDKYL